MTEIQLVPPPRDGLAEAFRAAAARRRKKAATTGGAGLTAAALVFVALTGGTSQVLTQEPAPPADAPSLVELVPGPNSSARTEPLPPAPPAEVALAAGPAGPDRAEAPFRVAASAAAHPATPAPIATAPPADEPSGPRYRTAPVTREDRVVEVPTDFGCLVESSSRNGRLCSQIQFYDGGTPALRRLELYLCNSTTTDKRLEFPREDDVDYTVLQGSEVVWRWSVDHSATTSPHDVIVYTGTCTVWSTPYSQVDQQGQALPKGAYTLRGSIDSADAGLAAAAVGQFTIR